MTNITKPEKTGSAPCYRCGGDGIYSQFHGQCFRCGGSGIDPKYKDWVFPSDWTDEQIAEFHTEREERNRKARLRRHERKLEKRQAQLAKNLETFPQLVPIHERYVNRFEDGHEADATFFGGFAGDVLDKAAAFDLTDKQVAAVVRAVDEHDAKLAAEQARLDNTPPIEEGTFKIVGKVLTIKYQENQWGGQMKQLVELDNGQRLWGTQPTSLQDAEVGDWVSFKATVSPSTDDHTFGFYSRPRKGQVLDNLL